VYKAGDKLAVQRVTLPMLLMPFVQVPVTLVMFFGVTLPLDSEWRPVVLLHLNLHYVLYSIIQVANVEMEPTQALPRILKCD